MNLAFSDSPYGKGRRLAGVTSTRERKNLPIDVFRARPETTIVHLPRIPKSAVRIFFRKPIGLANAGWRGHFEWTNDDTKAIRIPTAVNMACTMVSVLAGVRLLITELASDEAPSSADVILYL